MRTWVKATIGGVTLVVIVVLVLSGIGGYYVFQNLDTHVVTQAEGLNEFQVIRARFGTRPPLIEIQSARMADIKINHPTEADGRPVTTLHVLTWEMQDNRVLRTAVPLWLMRFSSANILSQLGVAPERFSLTLQDIQRYGPGVVVDLTKPGNNRILIWVD